MLVLKLYRVGHDVWVNLKFLEMSASLILQTNKICILSGKKIFVLAHFLDSPPNQDFKMTIFSYSVNYPTKTNPTSLSPDQSFNFLVKHQLVRTKNSPCTISYTNKYRHCCENNQRIEECEK